MMMVVNLLVRLFARRVLNTPGGGLALMVNGNVLGVLQVALGIQIIIAAVRLLVILAPAG